MCKRRARQKTVKHTIVDDERHLRNVFDLDIVNDENLNLNWARHGRARTSIFIQRCKFIGSSHIPVLLETG